MKNQKKQKKKKSILMDYKGYLAVLTVLFVLLFVLIKIAVGIVWNMSSDEIVESKQKDIKETVKESMILETKKELQTVSETETIYETETEIKETTLPEPVSFINEDSLLILINRDHPIPESMTYTLVDVGKEHQVDSRMYDSLIKMLSDAEKQGYSMVICSSWRSHELQEKLYENELDEYLGYGYSYSEAQELAAFWVALPGTSEHEVGLAVDIVSEYYQYLDHGQADTKEQQWLMQHCHEYGFILRYPEDKQEITQIGYEPWHYRYVGKEAAAVIMEKKLCLEEYLQSK